MVGTADFIIKNTIPSESSSSMIPQATSVNAAGTINTEKKKAKRETTIESLIGLMTKGLIVPQHWCAPQGDVG